MKDLLVSYLKPHWRVLVLIAFLLLVQAIGGLILPSLTADIINNGVVTGDTGYILRIGGVMLLLSVLVGLASVVTVYFSARTAMRFGREVRGDLFRRVENVTCKSRPWIEAVMYVGPDRRRFNSGEFAGAKKRRSDAYLAESAGKAG